MTDADYIKTLEHAIRTVGSGPHAPAWMLDDPSTMPANTAREALRFIQRDLSSMRTLLR